MIARATENGLCLLAFGDLAELPRQLADLEALFGATAINGESTHLTTLRSELDHYFSGELTTFSVALVPVGTGFQQSVWGALSGISFGSTVSYGHLARAIGKPLGSQAVGKANGQNRLAIVVPCHRVVGATGKLTGYAGGIERKKWLLRHESACLF